MINVNYLITITDKCIWEKIIHMGKKSYTWSVKLMFNNTLFSRFGSQGRQSSHNPNKRMTTKELQCNCDFAACANDPTLAKICNKETLVQNDAYHTVESSVNLVFFSMRSVNSYLI